MAESRKQKPSQKQGEAAGRLSFHVTQLILAHLFSSLWFFEETNVFFRYYVLLFITVTGHLHFMKDKPLL